MLRNLHDKVLNKEAKKLSNENYYRNSAPDIHVSGARRHAQSSEPTERNHSQSLTSSLLGISAIIQTAHLSDKKTERWLKVQQNRYNITDDTQMKREQKVEKYNKRLISIEKE